MDLPPTETAGDAHADVLLREPQFLLTMGAFGIYICLCDRRVCRVKSKVGLAELALHPLSDILPIDLQFLCAVWAAHEYAGRCDFNHGINLLQRDENGNLNTFPFEFRIQQCPAFPTMNNIRRHVFAALWAKPSRPSRHITSFIAGSKSTATRKLATGNLLHVPNHHADFECIPLHLRHGCNLSGFFVGNTAPDVPIGDPAVSNMICSCQDSVKSPTCRRDLDLRGRFRGATEITRWASPRALQQHMSCLLPLKVRHFCRFFSAVSSDLTRKDGRFTGCSITNPSPPIASVKQL